MESVENKKNTLEESVAFESQRLIFKLSWNVDSAELAAQGNDINIASAVGDRFPFPYTVEEADNFKKYVKEVWVKGTEYNFGIFSKDTGSYIGNNGFKTMEDKSVISNIGYWLGKAHHGKGYATEALRAILDFIKIKFPQVKEIHAGAFAYNIASQSVLKKCGFVEVAPKKVRRF